MKRLIAMLECAVLAGFLVCVSPLVSEQEVGAQWQVPAGQTPTGRGVGTGFYGSKLAVPATGWSATASENAKCDGVTDDKAAITAALAAHEVVILPTGTCLISSGITIPAGKTLIGSGSEATTVLASAAGINMFTLSDASVLANMTIDGSTINDVTGGSGVFFSSTDYALVENVHIRRQGFYGIAYVGSTHNRVVNVRVDGAGHRCMNMSESSTNNIVTGFLGTDCRKAGIIVGFLSNFNVFTNVNVSGHVQASGGAGLWVHMNANWNVFSDVVIGPAASGATTTPSIILAAGAQFNTFNNITIEDGLTRAIYIWNLDVTNPELGTVDADISGNSFTNVRIKGTSAAASAAILFNDQTTSASYTIKDNFFGNFYVENFTNGVNDCFLTSPAQCTQVRALAGANTFSNFTFEGVTTQSNLGITPTQNFWAFGTTYLANGQAITGRNAANSADMHLLQVDGSDILQIGNSADLAGIKINRTTTPAVDNAYALGSASFRWSDLRSVLATIGTLSATTLNGNTFTAGTYTLTGAAGKTLTFSNTLTFTGTDSSSVAFGTGGTVLYSANIGSTIQAWDADLDAVAALSSTGLAARTGSGTWAVRTLTAPAAGISVSNGDGVAGNPTLALANDLSALEGLSSTGIAVRTTTDTWAQRTITGTANEITVSNGDGVSGNPTLSLPSSLTFTGKTITGGTYASVAALTVTGTVNFDGTFNINASGSPSNMNFIRGDAHGSGVLIGQFQLIGKDSGGTNTTYAQITGVAVDDTDTSEDGSVRFATTIAGTLQNRLLIGAGAYVGSASDPGIGAFATSAHIGVGTKIRALGSAPAVSSCGTTPAISGSDLAGMVTTGTGTPTSCTITFNAAYSAEPYCIVHGKTAAQVTAYTQSTTALVVTTTATDNVAFIYHCYARSAGWLLKRDLDPASNDNTPAFMENAA